ncbi:asparaginase [Granulicella sp. WH15]|uniref:asparaginase n=1 Tax=Granulicella sp. WH15 TaxID=2602070 RepID=UPI0013679AE9|nr:asparaginase [Granulicella sp. WH15]QHN02566.1 asparaginase [Granulicella sp. WH15]
MKIAVIAALAAFTVFSSAPIAAQEIPNNLPPITKDQSHLPHVVLMSMGGTIASRASDRLNITNYGGKGIPRVDPQDWVHDMPELANVARITTEDMRPPATRTDSSDLFEDLRRVAKRLNELAKDPGVDGIVVTHGTNTMAEFAYYMDLTVDTDKPIVFVGSQRPWTGISGDGPLNLYNAVRVAASPMAGGKGVLQCMNQNINTARDVTKASAYRVQTFRGVDVGAIGFADPDKVVFYREPTRKHTTQSAFAGMDYATLPPVEVFYAYTDAPGYLIDAAVEHGVKGIVVDGTGAGSPTASETEAIKRAQAKGVVVVITARVHGGRVQETPRRTEAQLVNGDNLPPEKARLLLQLALTKTNDWREVKKYFDEY